MQIHIHVSSQSLDLLDPAGRVVRQYPVSTSQFGLGTMENSLKTPLGNFCIAEKIGDGAPLGMIFESRQPTGEFGVEGDPADRVQTRILWLQGLDSDNENTHSRYIYLHGTNQESLLGTPASHGCIRLSNVDIVDLYEQVDIGTPVQIG